RARVESVARLRNNTRIVPGLGSEACANQGRVTAGLQGKRYRCQNPRVARHNLVVMRNHIYIEYSPDGVTWRRFSTTDIHRYLRALSDLKSAAPNKQVRAVNEQGQVLQHIKACTHKSPIVRQSLAAANDARA